MNSVGNQAERRYIDHYVFPLAPRVFIIQLPDKKENVGQALFLEDDSGKAICWHMFIRPEYRRKGFATNLMDAAKMIYKEIVSDWENSVGHDAGIRWGFRSRKSDGFRLVWKKEIVAEKKGE